MTRIVSIAAVALLAASCGSSGSSTPSTTTHAPASTSTTQPAPIAWNHDPRCTLAKLTTTEVALMDDGLIPHNAKNESSAHVLAVINKAETPGASCDLVRERMRELLEH